MEISVRKEVKERIQSLAARQNIDVEQVSEALVRRGLETYLAEQAAGTDTVISKRQ
ncbi:MAG: hypothetical protein LBQ38_08600 [Spirochaetaceae bacterium]|jgi:hypothetical protein|nr:hypothetical protein [Spirochaetaceae bacterium]